MTVTSGCKTVPRDGTACRKVKSGNDAAGAEITPKAGHRGASAPRNESIITSQHAVPWGCALLAAVKKWRLWSELGEGNAMGTAHNILGSTSNPTAAFPSTAALIHPAVSALCQQGFPQGSCESELPKPAGSGCLSLLGSFQGKCSCIPAALPKVFHSPACIRARLPWLQLISSWSFDGWIDSAVKQR